MKWLFTGSFYRVLMSLVYETSASTDDIKNKIVTMDFTCFCVNSFN